MQVKLTNNEIRQIKDEFYSGKKQKEDNERCSNWGYVKEL